MKNTKRTSAKSLIAALIALLAITFFTFSSCGDGGENKKSNDPTYAIGDTGPGGGIVFYDKGSISDGWRYLEAALSDIATGPWLTQELWVIDLGGMAQDWLGIPGTMTAIGKGKGNTAAILAADATAPAAKACVDYRGPNNKDDWFLPSKDELNEMHKERTLLGTNSERYWSSSLYLAGIPWCQWFGGEVSGVQENHCGANCDFNVRPIRAF
jgi:hypothetical protein